MTILAQLDVTARGGPTQDPHGSLDLDVTVLPGTQQDRTLHMDATVADAAGELIPTQAADPVAGGGGQGQRSVQQLLVLRLYVGGTEVTELIEGWSVEMTPDGTVWELAFPADEIRNVIGWEVDHHGGAPPAFMGVQIDLEYGEPAITYTLLNRGIADESGREISPDGHYLRITGMGSEALYDRARITYQLDPHHDKKQGLMIREVAALLGIPGDSVDVGAALGASRANAVDIDDQEGLPAMREMAEGMSRALRFDAATSQLVAPEIAPTGTPEITFQMSDLVASTGIHPDGTTERLTCLIVEGERATRSSSRTGTVTTEKPGVTIYAPYSVPGAYHWQSGAPGTFAALTSPGPREEKTLKIFQSRIFETTVDGCLSVRRTETYGYGVPEVARYKLATSTDGEPRSNQTICYIYDSAAADGDSAKAYLHRFWKFGLRTVKEEVFTRDDAGRLTEKETRHGGWYYRRDSVKGRSAPDDSWDLENYHANQLISGDGHGMSFDSREKFFGKIFGIYQNDWLAIDTTTYDLSDDNYIHSETETREEWRLGAGWSYLYGDGTKSHDVLEVFEPSSKKITSNIPDGNSHRKLAMRTDAEGKLIEQKEEPGQGYLPEADICTGELLDRTEAQSWEQPVCVSRPGWPERTDRVSQPYVETQDEAVDYATALLIRDAAITVRFAIPVMAALRPKMPARIEFGDYGLVGDGWIETLRHAEEGQDEPALTFIEFKLRVV